MGHQFNDSMDSGFWTPEARLKADLDRIDAQDKPQAEKDWERIDRLQQDQHDSVFNRHRY